jgi:hypothetical protein
MARPSLWALATEWKMVRWDVILGLHQALDYLDGFFLGVTLVRGIVSSFRFE